MPFDRCIHCPQKLSYKWAYIGFWFSFGDFRGEMDCPEVREMTQQPHSHRPFLSFLCFPFLSFRSFLSYPFFSLQSLPSSPSPTNKTNKMSTGTTQAQPIIAFLHEQRVVPDLFESVPGTLEGELVVAYPTHSVTYVCLSRHLLSLLFRYSSLFSLIVV
jgi:hypothetical protein